VCLCIFVNGCVFVFVYVCICICMCVYVYVCVRVSEDNAGASGSIDREQPAKENTLHRGLKKDVDLYAEVDQESVLRIHPFANPLIDQAVLNKQLKADKPLWLIEEYNRDTQIVENHPKNGKQPSPSTPLVGKYQKELLPTQSTAFRTILSTFSIADSLAVHYQKTHARVLTRIFSVFLIGLVTYCFIDREPLLILIYLIALPPMGWFIVRTRKKRIEDRYLDYRALAEGLRVLVFWHLSGLNERVASYYLTKHRGALSWIRKAMRTLETMLAFQESDNPIGNTPIHMQAITELWVNDQIADFSNKINTLDKHSKNWNRFRNALIYIALAVTALFSVYFPYAEATGFEWDLVNEFKTLLACLGALLLGSEAYKSRMVFKEEKKQYALMHRLFSNARARLVRTEDPPAEILLALGREALAENGSWLWLHRHHPVEVPQ